MNWLRQNRALGTLLIVFGICALFAGIVLYWRWATWREARQTYDQAAAERSRLEHLDPFPNETNYRKLQGYLDRYGTALERFKEQVKKEVVPAPPLAPNDFQSRLRQATVATLNRAQTNNVRLPDKFQLGFGEFATVLPDTPVAQRCLDSARHDKDHQFMAISLAYAGSVEARKETPIPYRSERSSI
ncbi:MAG: Amuc_1100 family pilus-like protein [Candidatus Udaeobacter sp.]